MKSGVSIAPPSETEDSNGLCGDKGCHGCERVRKNLGGYQPCKNKRG